MKPKLSPFYLLSFIFYLLSFVFSPSALSQVPRGFNYQAIVRDGSNHPIISQPIKARITIETSLAATVYQEEHSLSTDEFGIMAVVIGDGTPVGTDLFADIDWNKESLYIKTELQYPVGGSYTEMGTAPLLSVPYAMVADSLSTPITKLLVKGETTSFEEPLFEVRNKDGKTVFAVYNEGVRIYVGDGAVKGPKGGFAIGGFGSAKDENSEKYLWVDDDSVRVYINDAAKSAKGGFAIGGYGSTKGLWFPRYLRVTSDSTRVMTTDPVQGFGVKSGTTGSYLRLTPENYFIGHGAGRSIGIGKFNSFIGYEAGKLTTYGKENIFIGYQSGLDNIGGKWNTFLGYKAGMTNTGSDNTFIGYMAGSAHESQGGNVYIGSKAGQNATNGAQNVLIGESTGAGITTGSYNVMLGFESGKSNQDGERNVFLGYQAGWSNTIGRYNVFIGDGAGYNNIGTTTFPGNYNVFIGYLSGNLNKTGQDNVFIGKQSGWKNDSGGGNVYIGMNAGGSLTDASNSVIIGSQAGSQKTGGGYNILIGGMAGYQNAAGSGNIFLGNNAGQTATGNGNIFIGNSAGNTETGSSLLFIENNSDYSSTPLIGGDFSNTGRRVAINGKPDPAGATLQVNGSLKVGFNGSNLGQIIKVNITKDLDLIPAGGWSAVTFDVPNAPVNSSVMISPRDGLPDGLLIAYTNVSVAGTVVMKIVNTTGSPVDLASKIWYITVIQ